MRIEQEDIQKKIQKNIKYQLFYSDKYLAIDSKKKMKKTRFKCETHIKNEVCDN